MGKYKKYGEYVLFAAFGIYTADVLFRFIRYISAACSGDMILRIIMLLKEILDDGASFMILNAAAAVVIIGISIWLSAFKIRTVAAYSVSAVSAITVIIAEKCVSAEWGIIMNIIKYAMPVFILSSVVSIFFSVKELYSKYLKN